MGAAREKKIGTDTILNRRDPPVVKEREHPGKRDRFIFRVKYE